MVLSVGDFMVATFSVEMSEVPTSLLGLASRWKWQNLGLVLPEYFHLPIFISLSLPVDVRPGYHPWQVLDGPLRLTLPFVILRTFDSWFQPLRLKLSSLCRSGFVRSFPQKGRSLLFFVCLV